MQIKAICVLLSVWEWCRKWAGKQFAETKVGAKSVSEKMCGKTVRQNAGEGMKRKCRNRSKWMIMIGLYYMAEWETATLEKVAVWQYGSSEWEKNPQTLPDPLFAADQQTLGPSLTLPYRAGILKIEHFTYRLSTYSLRTRSTFRTIPILKIVHFALSHEISHRFL